MIPRRPLIVLIGLLAAIGVLASVYDSIVVAWCAVAAASLATALADAAIGSRVASPQLTREAPGSMSIATWTDIRLTAGNNTGRRALPMEMFDHHPESFVASNLPLQVVVAPGRFVTVSYRVRPTQRGAVSFPGCELRIASPLRLWWRRRFVPLQTPIRVYPNYSTISKLLAYEVDNRLSLAGIRLSRRRGEGIEFHQLRDYRVGDSLRSVDWKATARMQRLIAREYQDERDQQIIFILDAGRHMLAKDGELSHFDHTLNAMLLLSYVALRQGDAAGIMTASDTRTWLPPRKGVEAINDLLNHVYDIQPRPIEIDYVAAATDLAARQRRRSLVVMLTNVREEDSEDLRAAIRLLRRRHLVILASLRERVLDDTLAHRIRGFDDALLYAATNQYLEARRESHKMLRAGGVFVEDCLGEELPSVITNRYLAIKRAGLL